MKFEPPKSWGEVVGLLTLLGLFAGYMLTQHERMSTLEERLAERPVLMERRDRETSDIKDDVRQLQSKLLCPCHGRE